MLSRRLSRRRSSASFSDASCLTSFTPLVFSTVSVLHLKVNTERSFSIEVTSASKQAARTALRAPSTSSTETITGFLVVLFSRASACIFLMAAACSCSRDVHLSFHVSSSDVIIS